MKNPRYCLVALWKPMFFGLSLLFEVTFCVRCLLMPPYLLNQQLINGWHNQNSAILIILAALFTCIRINVHPCSQYIEDQKRQITFSSVLINPVFQV